MKSIQKKNSFLYLRNKKRIGYAVYGNPKNFPIFYFHGWPGSRFELKNVPLKKKSCYVIAIERPGYGLSDPILNFKILDWPKIVIEVANYFKIKKFSIIGVSGGAPFAMSCAYAIKRNRLKSVAIICGLAPHNAKGMDKGKVGLLLNYGKKPILSWILLTFIRYQLLNAKLEKSFIKLKNKIPLPKPDLKLFTFNRGVKLIKNFQYAVKYGITGVHRDARLYANDWNFDLKKIKKKIFIWHGIKDLTVPVVTSKFYNTKLKNNELFIKSNEGHFSICYNYMNDIIEQVSA